MLPTGALPAFDCHMPCCSEPCSNRSISHAGQAAAANFAAVASAETDRLTDRCIDPAPYMMCAVPIHLNVTDLKYGFHC